MDWRQQGREKSERLEALFCSRSVSLGEAVARVGDRERAVRLCRHFDPVRRPIVLGRRRRSRTRRWGRHGSDRHASQLVIKRIRDEHAGNGVLLTAQEREVHLPEILEAWGGVNRLHGFRFATFAAAVVHNGNARMKRVYDHYRIGTRLSVVQTQK